MNNHYRVSMTIKDSTINMVVPSDCVHHDGDLELNNRGASLLRQSTLIDEVLDQYPQSKDGIAVDGGAHCGIWAVRLAMDCKTVVAYEPYPDVFALLRINATQYKNITPVWAALGDHNGVCGLLPGGRSFGRGVDYATSGVACVTIDSAFVDEKVSMIKLDLEGAELEALYGAVTVLKRDKPVLIVEMKGLEAAYGHQPGDVNDFLYSLGYRAKQRSKPDVVYVWK